MYCERETTWNQVDILPSYPENTDMLDQYLQNDDDEDDTVVREPETFDEIIVEAAPPEHER